MLLNDKGIPKTVMYLLWHNGEPIAASKSDGDVDTWLSGDGYFVQVVHPREDNPIGGNSARS